MSQPPQLSNALEFLVTVIDAYPQFDIEKRAAEYEKAVLEKHVKSKEGNHGGIELRTADR